MDLMKMTLDRLRGRTLVVKKEVAGGSGWLFGKKKQKFVVALPPGSAPTGVFQALDSPPATIPGGGRSDESLGAS
jgi:hypothetical protein